MTQDAPFHQHDSGVNGVARPTSATDPSKLPEICHELRQKIITFLEEQVDDEVLHNLQSQIRVSMGVIEEAMGRYKPEQLSISYNGGKDCLVLLVMILACMPVWPSSSNTSHSNAIANTSSNTTSNLKAIDTTDSEPQIPASLTFPPPLQAVYVVSRHPFPEVESFVATSATEYHLDLSRYALPMRPALEAYLGEKPPLKAIFVGTRRTDPHGEFLTHFDPTDKDWPPFMRVHPVIDWHYAEIWAFIRHLGIPFCSLYNQGFTSLGGMTDTHPNPALAIDSDLTRFRPAYELIGDGGERLGRES